MRVDKPVQPPTNGSLSGSLISSKTFMILLSGARGCRIKIQTQNAQNILFLSICRNRPSSLLCRRPFGFQVVLRLKLFSRLVKIVVPGLRRKFLPFQLLTFHLIGYRSFKTHLFR